MSKESQGTNRPNPKTAVMVWKKSDADQVSDSMNTKSTAKKIPSITKPITATGRKYGSGSAFAFPDEARERLMSWLMIKLIQLRMRRASPGVKQRGRRYKMIKLRYTKISNTSKTSITSETVSVCLTVYIMALLAMPAITQVFVGTGRVIPNAMSDRNSANIIPITVMTIANRSM